MDIAKIERSLKCLPGTSRNILIFTAIDQRKPEILKSLIYHDKSSINCIDGSSGLTPLGYCAQNQYLELCTILLYCGADINARDDDGWTALHRAAYHGHENIVQTLIQHGAKINCRTKHSKYSPLHLAVSKKHLNVVAFLKFHKANAKSKDSSGRSLLHMAVDSGLAEDDWVLLLNLDIDVNVENKLGQSPLMSAVKLNNVDGILGLFKRGADINMKDLNGKTPLYVATEEGHFEAMNFLTSAEAISQSYSKENTMQSLYPTSLHLAIFKEFDKEWLSRLLKVKSEYEELNCNNQTPLMLAVQLNNIMAAQLLLKAGVQSISAYGEITEIHYLDIAATYNNTTLFVNILLPSESGDILLSAMKSKKELLVEYLVQNREIVQDRHIEESIHQENLNILKIIIDGNLQLTKPIISIYSEVLMKSLYRNNLSTVRWIIKLDANVLNIKDVLGFSPLWVAVLGHFLKKVKMFIKAKCDPNCINERHEGKSLLQISIMNKNDEMVQLLLNKGAKPSIETDELLSAVLSKKSKIVEMILDANAEILKHHVDIAYYMGCDEIAHILIQRGGGSPNNKSSPLDVDGCILLMCRNNSSLKQFIKKLEELDIPPEKLIITKMADTNTMIQIADCWYPRNFNIVAKFSFANYARVKTHQEELENMCEKRKYISFANEYVNMETWINQLWKLPPVEFENESKLLAEVEGLIERGDDLNACIFGGWNPLHIAVYKGYHRVAQLLINKGAKGDFPNYNKDDSFTIAKRQQDNKMMDLLPISHKLRDEIIKTGNVNDLKLHLQEFGVADALLAIRGHENKKHKKEMLDVIHNYVSMTYPGSNAALYYYENVKNLKMVLEIDPSLVNSQNSITGERMLHKAIDLKYYKFLKIFELLEDFGVNLDLICNEERETALYKAIRTDRIEIAQLLIVAKADCTLGSHILNISSLELAKCKDLQKLVELMVNADAKARDKNVNSLFNLARISYRNSIPQKYFRKTIESLDIEKYIEHYKTTWSIGFIQEKLLFEHFCNGPALKLIKTLFSRKKSKRSCISFSEIIPKLRDWIESYYDIYYSQYIENSLYNLEQISESGCGEDIYKIHKKKIEKEFKNILNIAWMMSDWYYLLHNITFSEFKELLEIDPSLTGKRHNITKESILHILVEHPYFKYFFKKEYFIRSLDLMCNKKQETPLSKAIRTDRIEVAETLIRDGANCSLELAKDKNFKKLIYRSYVNKRKLPQ